MKKERENQIIKAMASSIADLILEQRRELFEAYGLAEQEAVDREKQLAFAIGISVTISPKKADHTVKTALSWSVKHAVSTEQTVSDQAELFDEQKPAPR